jgi:hypothetical protein
VSDVEHELLTETWDLRDQVAHLKALAEHAVTVAIETQDAHHGGHDPWLDEARASLSSSAPA